MDQKNQNFDFHEIERKWQKAWEKSRIFEVKKSKKKKFYVLEMFPYPSGSGLHMGHAFNYTIGDIYARFKRMNGFNVLYPVGYDSLGLPAENAAIKAGIKPKEYTEKAIKNFIKQQKELGLSYDWSRLIITHDPNYYKWDQWIFLQMFKKGLAYKKKAPVNYCPKCKTVLANEQVINGKCWRHPDTEVQIKFLEQWFFKITDYAEELYDDIGKLKGWPEDVKVMQKNWIGKSKGTEINFKVESKGKGKIYENWPIFTTRPDTIFGVTFLVISAQHPKLQELTKGTKQEKKVLDFIKKLRGIKQEDIDKMEKEGVFTGRYAINPINNEKVPIWVGNFVIAEYGSGMVMAVPAHDQRDFEFAKKYNLPIKVVIQNSLLGVVVAKKEIENELEKQNINYKFNESMNAYLIKSTYEKKENVFTLIQKYMKKESYSDVYVNGHIFIVLKDKIFDISKKDKDKLNKNELKKAQEEINKLKIPKKFSDLEKIRKEWKTFIYDNVWNFELKQAYTDYGILVNSGKFSGMTSEKAIDEISEYLKKQGYGKKTVKFRLKDWLISRQRYWGTPIPVVYCKKCGIVPVPEKDLPVVLPEKVKFGKGNPLKSAKKWIKTKCPVCGGEAIRETDTMDTFVNSSWYFLRYCDPKNKKKIFDKAKVDYWLPIDQYIGGKEHACMHLIYFRFYTKFLRDIGLLNFDEPALNLFNQGMLHGPDGYVMSKSRGNVVLPNEISKKYGIDTARLFLVSMASPDKDVMWSDKGIEGTFRFVNKIMNYFINLKYKKTKGLKGEKSKEKSKSRKASQEEKSQEKLKKKLEEILESKLNKAIKDVTEYIENFKYNLAVIEIKKLFEYIEYTSEKSEKFSEKQWQVETAKTAEIFLKLLHPFCPHITEELWHALALGKKSFISLEKWPKYEEKKIKPELEKEEQAQEKLKEDLRNITRIINKKPKSIFIYVIPKEIEVYSIIKDEIKKEFNCNVEIQATNNISYDPQNKAKKAKPGKPAVYIE